MKVELVDAHNKKAGTLEVSDTVFGAKWNPDLVHQAVRAQLANKRVAIAHTKGRGEVRGGGRKPWRQKGTGRARHGSTRSPIWIHGGVSHGPTKEKIFAVKINKKMKRLALFSVLSKKLQDGEVIFLDALKVEAPKTKQLALVLKNFSDAKKKESMLLLPSVETGKNVYRSAANLPKVKAVDPMSLSVNDVLSSKHVLIDQKAAEILSTHYKI